MKRRGKRAGARGRGKGSAKSLSAFNRNQRKATKRKAVRSVKRTLRKAVRR